MAKADMAVKETLQYRESLHYGLDQLSRRPLATTLIEEICSKTKGMEMQVRKVPGTAVVNSRTQETIYTPPQGEALLREALADWERFCHAEETDNLRGGEIDPLVRMAVLHYQFEAIHPFLDGNGRTGRVLNLLYLVDKGLLTSPVLYLSRYILNTAAGITHYCWRCRVTAPWRLGSSGCSTCWRRCAKQRYRRWKKSKRLRA